MNNQILYDKIISVTLYRPPYIQNAKYTASVTMGYGVTKADNGKSLSGRVPLSTFIEFYEGRVERVFLGYRKDKKGEERAVYKIIQSSGVTHYLNTVEEMQKGRSANGTIFKTGDKIRIQSDNSIWTAVVRDGVEGLEAKSNLQRTSSNPFAPNATGSFIVEYPAETVELKCTDEGLKPDMAFTINLLPGQNCYGAVLKVRNLNLENKDIRLWTRMVITAGYRTGITATYTCPIFTSYIEEPNPDGITVFEGITVGVAEGILNNRYTEIIFVQEKMKLKDLAKGVAQGIAPGIELECAISDEIMDKEINISKQTVYAQGGAAILSWLQTTISQFIQTISKDTPQGQMSAFIQLVDNKLQIIALNGPNKHPEAVENVISLDMVSGATFNGTALTVIAPWNPALQPGNLFYMPPEFINGSKLPNVLSVEDYRNEDNLYRAITISVSFASVENTNKMEVLAIPAQWAGQLPSDRTTSMTAEMLATVLNKDITAKDTITIGEESGKDTKAVNNVKSNGPTKKHMFDDNQSLVATWGAWTNIEIDGSMGSCLSVILENYFCRYANGPHMIKGTKGTQNEYSYFQERSYFEDPRNEKALLHWQSDGCWANAIWWPLTMVGTYWHKKEDPSGNWDNIDPKNPNLIHAGKSLYIPVWSDSWESQLTKMKLIKDIWKWAYIEYGKISDFRDMKNIWRAMYYYLGGTDELG